MFKCKVDEKGQTMLEYALVIVMISLVVILLFLEGPIAVALDFLVTTIANSI